ncbi:MAG: glycosyltransferase [Phycisphaeraceae bacterium]|nr:glycosyltransferase [Phycisphaeraceae bacterium]
MKILHYVDSTDSRLGGVPRFVLDSSRVMAAEGHPSTILTLDTTETPAEWMAPHDGSQLPSMVKLPRPALLGKLFGPGEMRTIRRELKKADVLHVHCVWSPAAYQIAAAARQMGVPYVVSCHGMLDDWSMAQRAGRKRAFMALGGRRFLEKAARVHCTAQAEVDQSKKWFPAGTETIVPYLIDLDPYKSLPGREKAASRFEFLRNGTPTVLFLSRLHYKKGPELLLKAAALLKARGIPGQFAFAGTGDEAYVNSLRSLTQQLGVADRVHFLGQVIGDEKLSLYQNADLFVLPTSQENFGLVFIEAMACGVPVVTTKGVDIWRDIESSGSAQIVSYEPEDIADSVAGIFADENRRREMADKARPWVFKTLGKDRVLSQFEQMYADAIATKGKPSQRTQSLGWQARPMPQLARA